MVEFTTGDLFKVDAEALVNTVNCVGVMGRGIAAQFKRAYPANFKAYAAACKREEVKPGKMFVFETGQLTNPRFVINFPTKRHWRGKSRIEDIDAGLDALSAELRARKIRSVAIPPLGCGLGGLSWSAVRPRIERALGELPDIHAIVFEPVAAPTSDEMVRSQTRPTMTPGRAVLVGLMQRYLGGLLDPFVSLLEVHKLMYFQQEAGEPLRLKYVPAPYGPYADNLRHVLAHVEGHLVSGYADGGDDPTKQLEVLPAAVAEATAFLDEHPETRERFERVSELVEGFESAFGMELLATVHWVATRKNATDPAIAIDETYRWNARKKQFKPEQIELAWKVLDSKGWLSTSSV